MKCDRCNRPAVVHQVVIEGGAHTEKHLCEVHAAEEGVPNPGKAPINQLLAKVVVPTQTVPSCPDCGITLTEIRRTSLLGCPRCYDTFGEAIEVIIRAAQSGASQHVGRNPGGHPSPERLKHESKKLAEALNHAVLTEQYERAAELKKQLTRLTEDASGQPKDDPS